MMCDRRGEILPNPDGTERLRVRREDKNWDWTVGMEAERKRVRYMPPQVNPGQKTIAGWIQARWLEELVKNQDDEQAADVITLHCLSGVAEHLLMGFGRSVLQRAIRRIRNSELQWVARIARLWLEKLDGEFPEPGSVQRFLWETQKDLRVA